MLALGAGPVVAGTDLLAGALGQEGRVAQHGTPEVPRAGVLVGGVDALVDGDEPDPALGELSLDSDALLEVAAEPGQVGDDDGVAGLQALSQLTPARAVEGRAGGVVDVDEIAADAVLLQLVELRLDAAVVAVGLADPGVSVGHGDHTVILGQGPF